MVGRKYTVFLAKIAIEKFRSDVYMPGVSSLSQINSEEIWSRKVYRYARKCMHLSVGMSLTPYGVSREPRAY
jgi:hypothetical protein